MGMFLAVLYEIVKYSQTDVALYYIVLSEESYMKLCKIQSPWWGDVCVHIEKNLEECAANLKSSGKFQRTDWLM